MAAANPRRKTHWTCSPRFTRRRGACIAALVLVSCQHPAPERAPNPLVVVETPYPRTEEPRTEQPSTLSESSQSPADSCVPLVAPEPETNADDLQIEFACGYHSAERDAASDFLPGGTRCDTLNELNTFALRLTGSEAERYSAVVRCGYIRYDNGTIVGQRVEVEARDGEWCHDLALEQIHLADRMLLTDVAFAIEALDTTAPARPLAVQFSTRGGWTEPVPSETNLCAYVSHRQPGYAACGRVAPSPDCICPCGAAWQDFFEAMELSLAAE